MWDVSLDHHSVFRVQGAAQREGSRKGYAGFHLVHVLVLPLHPRASLHARVPVGAIGIHGGQNFQPFAFLPRFMKKEFPSDAIRRAQPVRCEWGIQSSGRYVVNSSKQLSLCVLHTHAGRVNIVWRRWHSHHLNHMERQVSFENKDPSGKGRVL